MKIFSCLCYKLSSIPLMESSNFVIVRLRFHYFKLFSSNYEFLKNYRLYSIWYLRSQNILNFQTKSIRNFRKLNARFSHLHYFYSADPSAKKFIRLQQQIQVIIYKKVSKTITFSQNNLLLILLTNGMIRGFDFPSELLIFNWEKIEIIRNLLEYRILPITCA